MIDIDEMERIVKAGDRYGHFAQGAILALIAEVRALREDKARLDFYEANLESDRSREGIYSVWLEHGWGQEFTANSFREAIDHARGAK